MWPTRDELEAAHCWEADDRVPRRPEMTRFRQVARLHQARWRESHGLPIGTQPFRPRPGGAVRPVGSRLDLDDAQRSGANFLNDAAERAVRRRLATPEAHQSLDRQRLWADLLSSDALAFNLFGDLAADHRLADEALHRWVPDAPGRVVDVRFSHSPGRFDPSYLNSLRAFTAAFVTELDDGTNGIVSFDVKYHEKNASELPKPENRRRYTEVAERSGVFADGAIEELLERGDRCVMWLEHLLLLSMLQHESRRWAWGRTVVVAPEGNVDVADLCDRYRSSLVDDSTFATLTLEEALASGALPEPTATMVGERYRLG